MFELKLLSQEGIPGALDKAVRYRLLGQPREAESIYLDVLQAEPNHQPALVGLFLALTDQFDQHEAGIFSRAHDVLPRLDGDYERAYYTGIYKERLAHVSVQGNRQFNPGWHLALDLHNMLAVAEAITRAAISRTESRGGHTRADHPGTDPNLAKVNVVVRSVDGELAVSQEPLPPMPEELRRICEVMI